MRRKAHFYKPLVQTSNSYNRNFVLTFGHSAVRYIVDQCGRSILEEVKGLRKSKVKTQESEGSSNSENEVPDVIAPSAANLLTVKTDTLNSELQKIAQRHVNFKKESGGVVKDSNDLKDINGPDNAAGHQILEAKINREINTMRRSHKKLSKLTNDCSDSSSSNKKSKKSKKRKKSKKSKKDKKTKKSKKNKRVKFHEEDTQEETFEHELMASTKIDKPKVEEPAD